MAGIRIVLFSGGRGSGVLSRGLIKDPRVHLTVAINGYDDGASTGEVRRALGDSLGPSDFRKNASRLALELGTCSGAHVAALDARLPRGLTAEAAAAAIGDGLAAFPEARSRADAFLAELSRTGCAFNFGDCSVGNIVFAGAFLRNGRDFNRAIDDYTALLGLRPGLIENVTCGENAWLVGIDDQGHVLASEEELVGIEGHTRVRDIFLIEKALTEAEREQLRDQDEGAIRAFFLGRARSVSLNPRLASALAAADLIVYAPGTQHSSLFPSYLTPGLADVISRNLPAIKLLITNLRTDAGITGASAVDLIDNALYYLKDRGARTVPSPWLITHYLVNDSTGRPAAAQPYVPPGALDHVDDPRLMRIGNYEEGTSGYHDAAKSLGPFIQSLLMRQVRQRVCVLLQDTDSQAKVSQTLLEMVRGGIAAQPVDVTVFHDSGPIEQRLVDSLPFSVAVVAMDQIEPALKDAAPDYVVQFSSAGMYRGEDVAVLVSHLAAGRLDAVWGSRRLSVRDIEESLRFRYQKSPLFGVVSRIGSHVLSLVCLMCYGRYTSDTLSAVHAARLEDVLAIGVPVSHPQAHVRLLARLLRRKAELLELPVEFLPISPDRVRRTTLIGGFEALWLLIRGRFVSTRGHGVASDG